MLVRALSPTLFGQRCVVSSLLARTDLQKLAPATKTGSLSNANSTVPSLTRYQLTTAWMLAEIPCRIVREDLYRQLEQ